MKRHSDFIFMAIVVLVAATVSLAEGPARVLALDEAIAIAVANNDRIAVADARLEAAEGRVGEFDGARGPRIEIGEIVSATTNPVFVFGNKLGQEAFTVDDFDIDSLNSPDALTNFNTRLTISQPLWTGGEVKQGSASAGFAVEARQAGRERTRQEVVRDVIAAYTGAVLADGQLEVARQSLEVAEANIRLVADLHEGGLVVKSDLLQARVRRTEVQEIVIRAESAVEVSRARLNMVLGRDLDTDVALPASLDATVAPERPLDELLALATERRPDLEAADRQVQSADAGVRQVRGTGKGDIGLVGLVEANDENFIGAAGSNWSLFLNARFTLFDGKSNSSRVAQARAGLRESESMRRQLQRMANLEVRESFHDLRASRARLGQAEEAVELAQESLRIVRDRYGEGLTTLVELLDAETALTRSRVRRIAAERDLMIADASLQLATGGL